jgi:hypothetical protein
MKLSKVLPFAEISYPIDADEGQERKDFKKQNSKNLHISPTLTFFQLISSN